MANNRAPAGGSLGRRGAPCGCNGASTESGPRVWPSLMPTSFQVLQLWSARAHLGSRGCVGGVEYGVKAQADQTRLCDVRPAALTRSKPGGGLSVLGARDPCGDMETTWLILDLWGTMVDPRRALCRSSSRGPCTSCLPLSMAS